MLNFVRSSVKLPPTVYGLAMVGHLKNVCPTFAQKPNSSTNVEFTTVCPTIAKPMLAVRAFVICFLMIFELSIALILSHLSTLDLPLGH
jgi:hypothetical protein